MNLQCSATDLFNTTEDGPFVVLGATHGCVGLKTHLLKICYSCPTMMKLDRVITYLKMIQEIYKSCDTIKLCWNQHFSPEISKIVIWEIKYTFFLFFFTFIHSLKVVLINMIVFFVKPANLLTPGLFKIMRPGYVVMTS